MKTLRFKLFALAVALPTVVVLPTLVLAARRGTDTPHLAAGTPVITTTQPPPNATDVEVGVNVTVDFSEEMDPQALTTKSVTLLEEGGTAPIAAAVAYDSAAARVILNPDVDLVPGTMYTATVAAGVADLEGNALSADQVWSFTTAPGPNDTLSAAAPAAPDTTLTFAAASDALVAAATPDTNFGTSNTLRIDASPVEESYLSFTVTGITANVTFAKLRLWATNGTANGPTVYLANNGWTETGVTWNNQPARIGNAVDDLGAIAVNSWAEFSVTPVVTGDDTVTFNLARTSSDAVHFASREANDPALRPQLVVTFSGTAPTPPTVSADPPGGTYTAPVTVALLSSEPAVIHYTADGSDPSVTSPAYATPLAVSSSTTLRFFALTSDGRSSAIATEGYVVNASPPLIKTFAADADARVESANPATNFGASPTLIADASPATETYVRVAVSGLGGPVANAKLRLFVVNATVNGPAVYAADNGWTEPAITWNNRPARSGGIDDKGALALNAWVEFDVTPMVSGNGTFTFVLASTSSDGVSFNAKESADPLLRPQLVVTAADGTPPTVAAAPTGGTFPAPVDVTLTASEPATILYTANGSDPDQTSAIYGGPLHVAQTTTLKFIAVDLAGVTSSVGTEVYVIQGDFLAPETTIDSAPADRTNQTSAVFRFSASEPSTFECSLDRGAFVVCDSPTTYQGLVEGAHELQVRATDAAGNVDLTPAGFGWFVDLTAPTVTSAIPSEAATGVDAATMVIAEFSEDITPTSVTSATVRMTPQGSNVAVPATVTYDGPSRRATLDPAADLSAGASYVVTVAGGAGGVLDVAGNPLAADKVWSFTVASVSNPVTVTVNPVADALVDSVTATTNYGTTNSLRADGSPASQSYLKFTLTGISAPVTSARLRVFAFSSTNDGPSVLTTSTTWTETGVTWANRPASIGAAVDDARVIATQTWQEYNVASLVTGNGTYSFALVPTSSDGVDFYSRERATNRPELIVTYGGRAAPTVNATPPGGSYASALTVTLTASEPATIRFTTDGTTPTTSSAIYTAPVAIAASTTLKFFAVTADQRQSSVVTETYSIAVTGYHDFSFGSASAPTAKEGQSKVWYVDGTWFGALFDTVTGDFHVYKLDSVTQTWTDTGTLIDARNTARIDALWDGSKLYTVSAVYGTSSGSRAEVRRFSYAAGSFTIDAGFPVLLNSTGAEAITIDKATDGRLWVSYAAGNKIYATHTVAADTSWTTPFVIPGTASNVATDDISGLVSFADSIGVMWSNQTANTMYFGIHQNGAADSSWTVEAAYGVSGQESADDHINLKADSSGRVYAAVKTSLNAVGEPLIHLLVREPGGGWASHTWGTAENNHTRPVVMLSEQTNHLWLFATAPCCSGGKIYVKESSMSAISFVGGLGIPVIASSTDPTINNVSSTKQGVTPASGLLIIAGDDSTKFYLHNMLRVT